ERFAHGAPARAVAAERTCGAPVDAGQPTAERGTAGAVEVTVSRGRTVLWHFVAIRPAASTGTRGSGIELRDVAYRGPRILLRAHVPILNVRYDGDVCGPYRDWQWQEGMIQADGTDVAPGFRLCPTPAQTIIDSGSDTGSFLGVGIYVEGQETVLVSEMEAGWYRDQSEWRVHAAAPIPPPDRGAPHPPRFRVRRHRDSRPPHPPHPPRLLALPLRPGGPPAAPGPGVQRPAPGRIGQVAPPDLRDAAAPGSGAPAPLANRERGR